MTTDERVASRTGSVSDLGDVVKPAEEFVENADQLLGRAGAGEVREAHDISVQNTAHTNNTHTRVKNVFLTTLQCTS